MNTKKYCRILFICLVGVVQMVHVAAQKPKIKKITSTFYNPGTRNWTRDKTISTFDENGNQTECVSYNADGRLASGTTFGYNVNNQVIWERYGTWSLYLEMPDTSGCMTYYFYDEKGHYLRDSTKKFNNCFCMPGFMINGELLGDENNYNDKNQLTEILYHDFMNPDQLYMRTTYTYNESGNKLTETTRYYDEGKLERLDSAIHFYWENGGAKYDTTFSFEKDSVIYGGTDYDQYGNQIQRRAYEPLKANKPIKKLIFRLRMDEYYIYDENGNWIEKRVTHNGIQSPEVISRKIEYY